jgi:hypothetical protein
VALGKFDIKVGDQGVDIVVALYLQAEGRCERQLFCLHGVNVHLLQPREERMQKLTASTRTKGCQIPHSKTECGQLTLWGAITLVVIYRMTLH